MSAAFEVKSVVWNCTSHLLILTVIEPYLWNPVYANNVRPELTLVFLLFLGSTTTDWFDDAINVGAEHAFNFVTLKVRIGFQMSAPSAVPFTGWNIVLQLTSITLLVNRT